MDNPQAFMQFLERKEPESCVMKPESCVMKEVLDKRTEDLKNGGQRNGTLRIGLKRQRSVKTSESTFDNIIASLLDAG